MDYERILYAGKIDHSFNLIKIDKFDLYPQDKTK